MNRCVIVSGSSGGIGSELVRQLIADNYFVIGLDINTQIFSDKNFRHVSCDLRKYVSDFEYQICLNKEIKSFINQKKLVAIINNAALQKVDGLLGLTYTDWLDSLNINLLAPFFLVKNFSEELAGCHGKIINISSIHAKLSKPNFGVYAVTKSALSGLSRALTLELSDKISVYTISPAAVETEMLLAGFDGNAAAIEGLNQVHPTKKIGTVNEVSKVIIMLIKNDFHFLSGADINLDGGISSRLFDV